MNLGYQVPQSSDEEDHTTGREAVKFGCRVNFAHKEHQKLKEQLEEYLEEEQKGKEEMFYDPLQDLNNEEWMKTMTEMQPQFSRMKQGEYDSEDQDQDDIPLQERSLSCPGCFTEVCGECQAHQTHKNQYRALRVKNCMIDESEIVRPKGKPSGEKKDFEIFFRIKCETCGAELGVYEFEEKVYHFVRAIG